MHEFDIEKFKKLTEVERRNLLDQLIEEVKSLKKKVMYDEGPVVSGRTFRPSPFRNEWEEKQKLLTLLEKEHTHIMGSDKLIS